ncbi:MAG TPA: DUF4376 domain-containing protein [Ancylobacter sp.]
MQTYELTADEVSSLAVSAPPVAWARVRFDDGVLSVPDDVVDALGLADPATLLEARRSALRSALANKRWQVETGGVSVGGVPVRSDYTSQSKIAGAVSLFGADPTMTIIDFEAQPGVWVEIDAATMSAIGIAVGRHVQACFSRAKVLSAEIVAALDAATLDTIDINAGWPEIGV